jgi:hypothetical protein
LHRVGPGLGDAGRERRMKTTTLQIDGRQWEIGVVDSTNIRITLLGFESRWLRLDRPMSAEKTLGNIIELINRMTEQFIEKDAENIFAVVHKHYEGR